MPELKIPMSIKRLKNMAMTIRCDIIDMITMANAGHRGDPEDGQQPSRNCCGRHCFLETKKIEIRFFAFSPPMFDDEVDHFLRSIKGVPKVSD